MPATVVTDPANDAYLRKLLVRSLRKHRLGRLCSDEDADSSRLASLLSQTIIWSMVLSLAVWCYLDLGTDLWQSAGLVVLFLFALVGFAGVTKRFGTAALIILVAWLATGVTSALTHDIPDAAVTHLLPFVLVLLGIWMWGAFRLTLDVPFLLPLALIVVFVPLLTQDLWVLGDEIGDHLIAVGIVALGPIFVFTAVRYVRVDLRALIAESAADLRIDQSQREAAAALAVEDADEDDNVELDHEWAVQRLSGAYLNADPERSSDRIFESIAGSFRRQTVFRLGRLLIGTLAFFAAFTYVLAWAVIPMSTSSRWIGHRVESTDISFAYWSFGLPLGPYVQVALLLSIVAAAALLAFALTEDRYSSAVEKVLVVGPVQRGVLLAVPYVELFRDAVPADDAGAAMS